MKPGQLLAALLPLAALAAEPDCSQPLAPACVAEQAARPAGDARTYSARRAEAQVWRFEALRGGRPAWTASGCAARLEALDVALDEAQAHGLDPDDYRSPRLADAATACAAGEDTEREAARAWLALAGDLARGRVDPRSVEPHWNAPRADFDAAEPLLLALLGGGDLDALLREQAPADSGYAALRAALAQRRARAPRELPAIAAGSLLRRGDRDLRVLQLRARLAASGEGPEATASDPELFDAPLWEALRRWQAAAGLDADGVLGPQSLAELARGDAERIGQIIATLERWRWLPPAATGREIRVNIAAFELQARRDGQTERHHAVIVGCQRRQTPSFSGRMNHLVLNPWWETPRSIAVNDRLPQFRSDPGRILRLGYVVIDRDGREVDPATVDWFALSRNNFPYRLRQRPGPQNALGQVKLMFPNPHNIYLHDTPVQALFERGRRDYSAGCVRVQQALDLAAWALADSPGWDRARIDRTLASSEDVRVNIEPAIPVHLVYLTAVPASDGGLRLLADVYRRDGAVLEALRRR